MSDEQVRAQSTQEFKLVVVRQVKAGQSVASHSHRMGHPQGPDAPWVGAYDASFM